MAFFLFATNGSIAQGKYYIIFCAENGFPGHAFLSFGKEDNIKQASTIESWGFAPANNFARIELIASVIVSGTILGNVSLPGAITNNSKIKADYTLSKEVDFNTYNKAIAVKNKWSNNEYKLTESDCVSFLIEVADEVAKTVSGFIVPPRSGLENWPAKYLQKLIELNKRNKLTGKWMCYEISGYMNVPDDIVPNLVEI